MFEAWLIAILEACWLAVLWLLIPDSRPARWTCSAPAAAHRSSLAMLFLYAYVIYHLPVLLLAAVFRLLDVSRVRPISFIVLGVVSGFYYALWPPS